VAALKIKSRKGRKDRRVSENRNSALPVLSINGGAPAMGRSAITEVAQVFMTAFPDLRVLMDDLVVQGDGAVYHWTLIGTNTGLGGTGQRVRISGFEVWRIGVDGLIAESRGNFDSAAYQRQLERGFEGSQ
jgi:predicted ester cyclase